MNIERGDLTFKNVEVFEEFLKENLKTEFNLEAYLDDVFSDYSSSGVASYELGSHDTKSGRPETIAFDVTEVPCFVDGDEEPSQWKTEIEF